MATAALLHGSVALGHVHRSDEPGLIAYSRQVGNVDLSPEIWLMNADGTDQHRLTRGCCFAWSPDGRRIAFAGDDGYYAINVDGSGLRRLATISNWGYPGLAWSPDGTRIAFTNNDAIDAMDADGTGVRQLSSLSKSTTSTPRWSPNGKRIVYDTNLPLNAGWDIFIVNADGTGESRLTHDKSSLSPSWAPGGRRIAYVSYPGGGRSEEIAVMNADGSDQRLITHTLGKNEDEPQWSPVGPKIVFVSSGSIHTINPDGRRHRNLTPRGQLPRLSPQWSPDGRRIVFARFQESWDIYVMTSTGRNVTKLTHTAGPIREGGPAFSP